jgi:hypothetical protein
MQEYQAMLLLDKNKQTSTTDDLVRSATKGGTRSRQSVSVAAAANFNELCEAFRLVYKEYLRCGYITPHTGVMHYSVQQVFSTSRTFVAVSDRRVVGTGTVVIASPAGLPSMEVFGDVFESLAMSGRCVAEGTMLACTSVEGAKACSISLEIIPRALRWSVSAGVDDWYVVANPRPIFYSGTVTSFIVLGCDIFLD